MVNVVCNLTENMVRSVEAEGRGITNIEFDYLSTGSLDFICFFEYGSSDVVENIVELIRFADF